jgi:hypothetical protein
LNAERNSRQFGFADFWRGRLNGRIKKLEDATNLTDFLSRFTWRNSNYLKAHAPCLIIRDIREIRG